MNWTYNEKVILKNNYGKVSMAELKKLLPGRSTESIYAQVAYLRKKRWVF